MEFRLPENLQVELLSYDPALKALAKQNKPAPKKNKSKYPLGNPNELIPNDVIRQSMLDDAITNINSNFAASRFQVFKRYVTDKQSGETTFVTYAILYHYEQCWYAAWLPPEHKKNEYVYGYAVAYKDTAAAWKMLPHSVRRDKDQYQQKQYGRSVFYTYTQCVTKDDIRNGNDVKNWNIPCVYGHADKTRELAPVLFEFEVQLKKTIPTWSDTKNIFARIKSKSIANVLFTNSSICHDYWLTNDKNKWVPSYESLIKLITWHAHDSRNLGYESEYRKANKILHIISTPFFKKWIETKCQECLSIAADETNTEQVKISRPWKLIHELMLRIYYVHTIWPDCPIDYYQTHLNVLLSIRSLAYGYTATTEWLQKHMPVASFFTIVSNFYQETINKEPVSYNYSLEMGMYLYYFHEWNDTLAMLNNVLKNGIDLARPKRWRIEEFHDHVQAEAWKLNNKNENLPQDLFPTPVKVTLDSSTWSFFQPIDTHQLAQWGQAVRNCVGNATHYAENVRKKKHFIVLAMVDNKPQFTIQLDVNRGLMSVKQIAGIGNARLDENTKELYKTSFAKALQLREEQLKS